MFTLVTRNWLNQWALDDTVSIVPHLDILTPVTIEELFKIAPVVGSKSCTIDPIPASFLRENLDLLLPILCQIVNLSLESGCVPHSIKQAILKPLLKKASLDLEILSNFRPNCQVKRKSGCQPSGILF